jgi:phosphatidylserine/phosphatidylglycerophosphate/cardiolipin synthase-like enzyme
VLDSVYNNGVIIYLITDEDNVLDAAIDSLQSHGIPVKIDSRAGFMHDKYFVFDSTVVWTGSYNVTYNGTVKNANNVTVIQDRELALSYEVNFGSLWNSLK